MNINQMILSMPRGLRHFLSGFAPTSLLFCSFRYAPPGPVQPKSGLLWSFLPTRCLGTAFDAFFWRVNLYSGPFSLAGLTVT